MSTTTTMSDLTDDDTGLTLPGAMVAYLEAAKNPASLIDADELAAIESSLAKEDLSIPRRILLETRKAVVTDYGPKLSELTDAFITAAPRYARDAGISVETLVEILTKAEVGVDASVTRRILDGDRPVDRPRLADGGTADDVRDWISRQAGEFRTKEVRDATAASSSTVTRTINELVSDGVLVQIKRGRYRSVL